MVGVCSCAWDCTRDCERECGCAWDCARECASEGMCVPDCARLGCGSVSELARAASVSGGYEEYGEEALAAVVSVKRSEAVMGDWEM